MSLETRFAEAAAQRIQFQLSDRTQEAVPIPDAIPVRRQIGNFRSFFNGSKVLNNFEKHVIASATILRNLEKVPGHVLSKKVTSPDIDLSRYQVRPDEKDLIDYVNLYQFVNQLSIEHQISRFTSFNAMVGQSNSDLSRYDIDHALYLLPPHVLNPTNPKYNGTLDSHAELVLKIRMADNALTPLQIYAVSRACMAIDTQAVLDSVPKTGTLGDKTQWSSFTSLVSQSWMDGLKPTSNP